MDKKWTKKWTNLDKFGVHLPQLKLEICVTFDETLADELDYDVLEDIKWCS